MSVFLTGDVEFWLNFNKDHNKSPTNPKNLHYTLKKTKERKYKHLGNGPKVELLWLQRLCLYLHAWEAVGRSLGQAGVADNRRRRVSGIDIAV